MFQHIFYHSKHAVLLFHLEIIDLFLLTRLKKAYFACREVQSERQNYKESTGNWKIPARMQIVYKVLLQASLAGCL